MSEHDRGRLRAGFEIELWAEARGETSDQARRRAARYADVALRILGPAVETTTGTVGEDEGADLAMRARMAEEDAAELREALIQAAFRGAARPSNKTLLALVVERIEHSRRIAPDNPDGLPLPALGSPPATIRTVDDLGGLPAGTVLRMSRVTAAGPGALAERGASDIWWARGHPMSAITLVGATVLHVPGRGAGGITREQVVEAADEVLGGNFMLAQAVADRLGLVETEGSEG